MHNWRIHGSNQVALTDWHRPDKGFSDLCRVSLQTIRQLWTVIEVCGRGCMEVFWGHIHVV